MVPACANCGARNYDTPAESQGINMILAGRVKVLEAELEERKGMDAMNSDTAMRAYRLGAEAQRTLSDVIQQRDGLLAALSKICMQGVTDQHRKCKDMLDEKIKIARAAIKGEEWAKASDGDKYRIMYENSDRWLTQTIQQRDKLRTALVFLRAMEDMTPRDWKDVRQVVLKMADEALEETKEKK
jgi:hypothetical protein